MTRGKRNSVDIAPTESAVPDVLAARARGRLLRHQPGPRVGGRTRSLRQPAQRLLAPAPRRRVDAEAARAERAVRAARLRHRRDERGRPHDPRVERPASRRLRGFGRPPQAHRPRAPPASDRVRRQGGLPRGVRHARRPRATGAIDRRRRPLRPPVDLARERSRSLRRTAALVPRAQGLARARRADRGPGARARRETPHIARPVPRRRGTGVVDDARRRHRRRRRRRVGAPSRARRGARAGRLRARPRALDA